MTTAQQHTSAQYADPQPQVRTNGDGPQDSSIVRDARETRPAFKTTEFWIAIVAVAGLLVATYADSDSLNRVDGWRFVTFVVVAYLVSRGLAKVATSDRFDREWGNKRS